MHTEFSVKLSSFTTISTIEDAWTDEAYKALLTMMGLEDGLENATHAELEEMCLMSLSDFEHNEAARFVLAYLFPDDFTEGKLDQLSHDMPEDRLWEEFSDNKYHYDFFKAYGLLRQAFNGIFAEPTGVQLTIELTAKKPESFDVFAESPKAPLVRLLAGVMGEGEIVNRLYTDQIEGDRFAEAEGILWNVEEVSQTDLQVQYAVTSSAFWFGALQDVDCFEGKTHADTVADEEDE